MNKGTVVGVLVLSCAGLGAYLYPQYNVYQQRMAGHARLREAESSRQIEVEEAKAKLDSAKLLSLAEIERARGVAEANRIIGESLAGPQGESYLRYLWVTGLHDSNGERVYIATEAGMPILEARDRVVERGEK